MIMFCKILDEFCIRVLESSLLKLLTVLSKQAKIYLKKSLIYVDKNDEKIKSIFIMSEIYNAILYEIEKDNFDILNQQITITPIKKFYILYKYK